MNLSDGKLNKSALDKYRPRLISLFQLSLNIFIKLLVPSSLLHANGYSSYESTISYLVSFIGTCLQLHIALFALFALLLYLFFGLFIFSFFSVPGTQKTGMFFFLTIYFH